MTTRIRSHIEYLIPTDNILVFIESPCRLRQQKTQWRMSNN